MQALAFDIFAGEFQKDALWLEVVDGLDKAKERMEQIASKKPGKYFVFCATTHSVVATSDGLRKLDSVGNSSEAAS